MTSKNIVVLSGAGISAESGISTFRDAGGLWEGHDIMEVASPQGWAKNPELVLEFYNKRRRQLFDVMPNEGHIALTRLEQKFEVNIITQNVDDLHERAGSKNIIHLHGELKKVRSTKDHRIIYTWERDLNPGDTCSAGSQLRPHIVWFGEEVPLLHDAISLCSRADILIIVGTSLQVYPAAGLTASVPEGIPVYYVDPSPNVNDELSVVRNLHIIRETAVTGIPKLVDALMSDYV
jgi:NAD-dependent deacetylase